MKVIFMKFKNIALISHYLSFIIKSSHYINGDSEILNPYFLRESWES